MKRICKENGYSYTAPRHPYLSLFYGFNGESFAADMNGTRFACKLFCYRKQSLPVRLNENGVAEKIHAIRLTNRLVLFEYSKIVPYGFEAEGNKVLIICPTSKKVSIQEGNSIRNVDNGDTTFGYTVYSCYAFLNTPERDNPIK